MSTRVTSPNLRGLTIVELLAVVAIIGVLAALIMPRFHAYKVRARRGEAKVNLGQISALQGIYQVEHYRFRDLPLAGYKGTCDTDDGTPQAALGFTPDDCEKMRYGYEISAGSKTFTATAFGPSDADGRWIYPCCNGAGASECGESSGDKVRVTNKERAHTCRDITKYCDEMSCIGGGGGSTPPITSVGTALPPGVVGVTPPPGVVCDPACVSTTVDLDCSSVACVTADDPANFCPDKTVSGTKACKKETTLSLPADPCPGLTAAICSGSSLSDNPKACTEKGTKTCTICTPSWGTCTDIGGGVCEESDGCGAKQSCTCPKCEKVNTNECGKPYTYDRAQPWPKAEDICDDKPEITIKTKKTCVKTTGYKDPPPPVPESLDCRSTTETTLEDGDDIVIKGTRDCSECCDVDGNKTTDKTKCDASKKIDPVTNTCVPDPTTCKASTASSYCCNAGGNVVARIHAGALGCDDANYTLDATPTDCSCDPVTCTHSSWGACTDIGGGVCKETDNCGRKRGCTCPDPCTGPCVESYGDPDCSGKTCVPDTPLNQSCTDVNCTKTCEKKIILTPPASCPTKKCPTPNPSTTPDPQRSTLAGTKTTGCGGCTDPCVESYGTPDCSGKICVPDAPLDQSCTDVRCTKQCEKGIILTPPASCPSKTCPTPDPSTTPAPKYSTLAGTKDCTVCSCGDWTEGAWADGSAVNTSHLCPSDHLPQPQTRTDTRSCTPAGCDSESKTENDSRNKPGTKKTGCTPNCILEKTTHTDCGNWKTPLPDPLAICKNNTEQKHGTREKTEHYIAPATAPGLKCDNITTEEDCSELVYGEKNCAAADITYPCECNVSGSPTCTDSRSPSGNVAGSASCSCSSIVIKDKNKDGNISDAEISRQGGSQCYNTHPTIHSISCPTNQSWLTHSEHSSFSTWAEHNSTKHAHSPPESSTGVADIHSHRHAVFTIGMPTYDKGYDPDWCIWVNKVKCSCSAKLLHQ